MCLGQVWWLFQAGVFYLEWLESWGWSWPSPWLGEHGVVVRAAVYWSTVVSGIFGANSGFRVFVFVLTSVFQGFLYSGLSFFGVRHLPDIF